jgi:hypothetical protein
MTSRYGLILALALAARAAAPALARADVLLPPYDGSQQSAAIVTDDEALTALHRHGVTQISTLGRVGDYWEGEGLVRVSPSSSTSSAMAR